MEETTAQKVEAKGQLESAWIDGALEAVMKIILNSTETQHNHRVFVNSLSRYKTFEEELAKKSWQTCTSCRVWQCCREFICDSLGLQRWQARSKQ